MSFKVKLIISFIAFGLIVGALMQALLHYQFPQYYPAWYEGIILFFLILEHFLYQLEHIMISLLLQI